MNGEKFNDGVGIHVHRPSRRPCPGSLLIQSKETAKGKDTFMKLVNMFNSTELANAFRLCTLSTAFSHENHALVRGSQGLVVLCLASIVLIHFL